MKKKSLDNFWSVVITLGMIAGLFVLANYGYFAKQVAYYKWNSTAPAQPVEYRDPNTVYIPSLNITAPLVYIDETGEQAFQAALANGVVHYPGTALPGQGGNAYYFGHSSDYPTKPGHFKTVFAVLPKIQKGAEIVITDDKGKVYKYLVTDTEIAQPDDTSWLDQGDLSQKRITLQTSYPVGTALRRFLAIGELEE